MGYIKYLKSYLLLIREKGMKFEYKGGSLELNDSF
jgi:hypothetical protein